MINNAAAQVAPFAPGAPTGNRQPGQLSTSLHVRILAPGLAPSPCTPHRLFCTFCIPTILRPDLACVALAVDFRSLPACLCLCVLLCLAIESPPPRRPSRAAAALPKSISKPYPSHSADQQSPSNDPTATDDDRITRAADEKHLRLRIDPAEYWSCDPRLSTQSAARNLYLHRGGDNCESERQAPAYREHFLFFSRLSYLCSSLRRATECHAVTASAGLESTSYLARLSLDLHLTLGPACLPPIYATRLGIILSQLCLWGSSSFPFLIWNSPPGQSLSIHHHTTDLLRCASHNVTASRLDFVSPASQATTPQRTDLPTLVFCLHFTFLVALHGFFWRY